AVDAGCPRGWAVRGTASGTLAFALARAGRGEGGGRLTPVHPSTAANRVLYNYGPTTELYSNGPYGLEQAFVLHERPARGAGPLVLALASAGSLTPSQAGSQVLFRDRTGAT